MTLEQMMLRLALAMLAGGLVGLERERHDRPAGLRTHMLVCLGSTLITLVSTEMAGPNADRTRIAAQIVTGIGFLGAGTIFRANGSVRGLTTAAGLWVVAGIGMGIGAGGAVMGAALITALVLFAVNNWIRVWEDRLLHREAKEVMVSFGRGADVIPPILEGLQTRRLQVEATEWLDRDNNDEAGVRLRLVRPEGIPRRDQEEVTRWLADLPGVHNVEWR
jgi:putative Mg2+ transporter-C (MgtC) family protein